MDVDGSCHCGYVRFECKIEPEMVSLCHCIDCQHISGSAFRINVPAAANDLRVTAGEPKTYVKHTAESGKPRENAFCPRCGTALYAAPHNPETSDFVVNIRVAALRQRDELPPKTQNWMRSAQIWMKDALPFPKNEKV